MTDLEQRQFDHLLNGIKTNLKLWDDTPPHARFGFPPFQIDAVAALVKKLDTQSEDLYSALNALTVSQEEWLLKNKHLDRENYRLARTVEKLKRLILLTDPSVSDVAMNELSVKQWNEFLFWEKNQ